MAFLPERNFFEENLANSYDLTNGPTSFVSSDVSNFITLSLQFVYTSVNGQNVFSLFQSNDNVNWSHLSDEFEKVKIDVVKVYDYWKFVEEQYHDVNNEIRKRNI